MSEHEFSLVRSLGFVTAAVIAVGLQRLRPHARLRGSWRVNLALWAINLVAFGTVCGACVCTAARWAERNGIG